KKFARSPTTWKQVLNRPPEPKASPHPTNWRCMSTPALALAALGQPHDQPDRHHQDGAEEEIAPHPDDRVPPHVPDGADQPLDAAPDVPGIEPERGKDHADQDR